MKTDFEEINEKEISDVATAKLEFTPPRNGIDKGQTAERKI